MNLDEYSDRKEQILDSMFANILLVLLSFMTLGISRRVWFRFLNAVYPRVKRARDDAAFLAREFFDDNRAAELRTDDRVDFFAETNYEIDWFAEAVEPVFEYLQDPDADPEAALSDFSNRLTKIVEDGARRTLLRGVEADEDCLGWARFDPRPPTCAFCTLLISRGPDYKTAQTAGFRGTNEQAEDLIARGDFDSMNALMNRWHPGCTCAVVPVYKYSGYQTERQEEEAFQIYKRARRAVLAEGKKPTAKNILNEMRRMFRVERKNQDEVQLPAA